MSIAICAVPNGIMPAVSRAEYHAPVGRSVTGFTVVRSLLLLRVRAAEIGPEQRLLPAPAWSRLGAKQTPLEVARMTLMTHSDISGRSFAVVHNIAVLGHLGCCQLPSLAR
jgi:hypothetical protein